eukprot:CAMPEP_0185034564 /NCGR_PEP_ID=MMETSP1103-20130426/24578_1 /TAXON_ID=36769 /ORGANISM="Paraphysomonas bandaiensis, Strain Caron Lab Isolate" /LENGTH=200 /DNA_ID=CAMNT_0027571279 /DNA_START=410 /DNA_END=1012 /DNA_ORIENTATION=-
MDNSQAKKAYDKLDELNYLAVTAEIFCGICRTHRVILEPVTALQEVLRKKFLGKEYWEKATKNREEMTDNNYVPIKKLLEIQAKRLNIRRTLGWQEYNQEMHQGGTIRTGVVNVVDYHVPVDSYPKIESAADASSQSISGASSSASSSAISIKGTGEKKPIKGKETMRLGPGLKGYLVELMRAREKLKVFPVVYKDSRWK